MSPDIENDFSELKRRVLGIKMHPHLKKVSKSENSFKLKRNHDDVIAELHSLEDLFKALERAPHKAINFHLRDGRNDFATWVEEVFGNEVLSEKLRKVSLSSSANGNTENIEDTRWKLVGALYNEITELKKLSQLHPDDLR